MTQSIRTYTDNIYGEYFENDKKKVNINYMTLHVICNYITGKN